MNFSTFSLNQEGALLRVTLENPPINLMSLNMVEELFQLAGRLHSDPSVKVVLFDSADPDFFIAHFDIEDMVKANSDPSKASKYADINALQSLGLSWKALPQITIAEVNGCCRGGGLEFILALDMRFATLDSRFCFPEASSGFLAAGGGATLTALAAGPARALEFLLSSRDFNGEEAERYGLLNRALPAAELDAYLDDLVNLLLARSTSVIAMHKAVLQTVYAPMVEPVFAGLGAENDGMRKGMDSAEMQACVAAALNMPLTREQELNLPATLAGLNSQI
ncbi:enoyl-CoA hydratase/isomerase family protein [Oceanobacter antarcticus]|uniref:Enoyl-CoA hydratase/isomerase family protein n=1 Tax=Oceanobacter antarcticus TaxID=3133425 RepID=A0ABW8NF06_9GAMM